MWVSALSVYAIVTDVFLVLANGVTSWTLSVSCYWIGSALPTSSLQQSTDSIGYSLGESPRPDTCFDGVRAPKPQRRVLAGTFLGEGAATDALEVLRESGV